MSETAEAEGTVGVIGGMGPAATGHFFDLLVERTPAEEDQDHLRVVVDSNPKVPDRIAHLLDDGPDPRPSLIDSACNVDAAGADVLAMPCNTAHAFFDDIEAAVDAPLLHMIRLGAERALSTDADKVGLLATDATIDLELYHDHFDGRSVELGTPDDGVQERVMDALYDIKAGRIERPRKRLAEAVDAFDDVDAVIAGCTEVPVALRDEDIDVPLVDPMTVLADEAIARAKPSSAPPVGTR